ncbi:MAG: hypothetical protein Q7R95_03350, partial [bacterium]|nr:hypothetical protein [bacterium]
MISQVLICNNKRLVNTYINNLSKQLHAIVYEFEPEKTEFSINQIKEIIHEVKIYQPQIRIYLLQEFEKSSIEAQNAFLKILEEPPTNVIFILTVSNINQITSTIISRTKIINLNKKPKEILISNNTFIEEIKKKKLLMLGNSLFLSSSKDDAIKNIDMLIDIFHKNISQLHSSKILNEILK